MKVVNQDTFKWYALEDGKTYGYPNYSNTKADYESGNIPVNDNFVIREDVYNALGKPDVSTPENFEKVMQQIKEKYPEMTWASPQWAMVQDHFRQITRLLRCSFRG